MATQVLIAHTGQRLEVDAAQFSTYDTSSSPSRHRLGDLVAPPLTLHADSMT